MLLIVNDPASAPVSVYVSVSPSGSVAATGSPTDAPSALFSGIVSVWEASPSNDGALANVSVLASLPVKAAALFPARSRIGRWVLSVLS